MKLRAGLLTITGMLVCAGLAWAADTVPLVSFGGTRWVLNTTDVAGVHTPHVIVDSGGGSGAVTIANGADVALGNTGDAAWTSGAGTVISLLKGLIGAVNGPVPTNPKTTTQAKLTVAVTNTYQQALAASSSRVGCTIQYIAVAGTKGYVFFGSAPADTTTSFQLTNGQTVNCNIGGVAVAQDAIQVTGTGTDIFIVANQ